MKPLEYAVCYQIKHMFLYRINCMSLMNRSQNMHIHIYTFAKNKVAQVPRSNDLLHLQRTFIIPISQCLHIAPCFVFQLYLIPGFFRCCRNLNTPHQHRQHTQNIHTHTHTRNFMVFVACRNIVIWVFLESRNISIGRVQNSLLLQSACLPLSATVSGII